MAEYRVNTSRKIYIKKKDIPLTSKGPEEKSDNIVQHTQNLKPPEEVHDTVTSKN